MTLLASETTVASASDPAAGEPAAFDGVAAHYDADFSHTALGQLLRARLWSVLERHLPSDGALLELGCGTGEDAVHLASRGAAVLATDQSANMVAITAAKAAAAGLAMRTAALDLAAPALAGDEVFAGAWSSFGPLNCVADRRPLWRFLRSRVRPGGTVVLVVMAPLTPWDWLWFGMHGQPRTATRRLRAGRIANAGGGETVAVWYPSWRTLRREAGAAFDVQRVEGIGAVLPISEAGHLVARFPRFFGLAARIEGQIAGLPPWSLLCDHYALVLRRTPLGPA